MAMLWAAVLRVGPEAVLSHQTAAELWKLTAKPATSIHVSVPRTHGTLRVPGIVLHHSSRLPSARHSVRTPPRTKVEETVLDLADRCDTAEEAIGWVICACQRGLTTSWLVRHTMAQRGRIRWRTDLGAALADVAVGVHSVLERRYYRNVESAHGLPQGLAPGALTGAAVMSTGTCTTTSTGFAWSSTASLPIRAKRDGETSAGTTRTSSTTSPRCDTDGWTSSIVAARRRVM